MEEDDHQYEANDQDGINEGNPEGDPRQVNWRFEQWFEEKANDCNDWLD